MLNLCPVPTDVTIWDWVFDSPASPISQYPKDKLAGYQDGITKERLDWNQVKEASMAISTSLVKDHGFKAGDTLALFSRNTIWYPVAMFGALRAGKHPSKHLPPRLRGVVCQG